MGDFLPYLLPMRPALQSHAVTLQYNFTTKEGTIGVHRGYEPDMAELVALFTGIDTQVELINVWCGSSDMAIFVKEYGTGWRNVFVGTKQAPSIKA